MLLVLLALTVHATSTAANIQVASEHLVMPSVVGLQPASAVPVITMSHYDESSEYENVSLHDVACYRLREDTDRVQRVPLRILIRVLELTKTEVDESSI